MQTYILHARSRSHLYDDAHVHKLPIQNVHEDTLYMYVVQYILTILVKTKHIQNICTCRKYTRYSFYRKHLILSILTILNNNKGSIHTFMYIYTVHSIYTYCVNMYT